MSRLSSVARGTSKVVEEDDALPMDEEDMALMTEEVPAETTIRLPFEDGTEGMAAAPTAKTLADVALQLAAPLDLSGTKTRKGYNGKDLTYLEWQQVAERLNRIFGFGSWEILEVKTEDVGTPDANGIPGGVKATVTLAVQFPDEEGSRYGRTANYTDVGFGEVVQAWDKEAGKPKPRTWGAYELALKSSTRDAFKRAAANLGNQFGLSLYGGDKTEAATDEGAARPSASRPAATSSSGSGGHATANSDGKFLCEDCGKEVKGYTNRNSGKVYSAQDVANFRFKDYGAVYCYDCKDNHPKLS